MPIDSDLQAAGHRAASLPVPAAPSIATLEAGAAKHTSKRRLILSGAAALVLVAVAFPLALTMRGTTTVQTVAVGTGQAGAAQTEAAPAAAAQGDVGDDADSEEDVRIQIRAGDDLSLSIRVLSGEQAVSAADAAASSATETLNVDDMVVWVSASGDERTVSALIEPQEFVEVTGNAAQLDKLIDVLRNGGLADRGGRQGLHGLEDAEWQLFFDQFEDGDFSFDIDGLDFDGEFEQFFGPDGEFGEVFGPDGEFGEVFGPDGEFEQFFGPDGFNFDGDFGESFDGCIVIDHARRNGGEPVHLEFPPGCDSAG